MSTKEARAWKTSRINKGALASELIKGLFYMDLLHHIWFLPTTIGEDSAPATELPASQEKICLPPCFFFHILALHALGALPCGAPCPLR